MNRPFWNSFVSGAASYNNLPTTLASYQNGFRGSRPSNGADCEGSFTASGGYERARYQGVFYGPASQEQFYGEGGYGQILSGSQLQRSPEPTAYHQAVSYSPAHESVAYHPAVHTTTPAKIQIIGKQYYAQEPQQYASNFFQYQPYSQSAAYGCTATPPMLTQQWQLVEDPPPPPPPPDSTFTQSFDANAPSFQPRRSFKNDQSKSKRSFHQSVFFDERVPPPPPDKNRHTLRPQQNSIDSSGVTTTPQKQAPKASTPKQNPRSPRPQLDPLSPRLHTQFAPATPDTHLHALERPEPTARYLEKAKQNPTTMHVGRPLLVVLDINGTLIHRVNKRRNLDFVTRPRVNEFLHYLFNNHHVMIWSSSQPRTVENYRKRLLFKDHDERLVACWARDKLRIPKHLYYDKVQVYKQLSWVWKDEEVRSANFNPIEMWSQENTVLVDDSLSKAASEPYNIVELEEFEGREEQMETDVLGQVVQYLETLRSQRDVSAYIRSKPFVFDPQKSFDWMPVINDMH